MTTPIEGLEGAPAGEIDLARVERELAALWAAAAPEDPGEERAVLRACALNLLVLGRSPEDLERARPIAARTTLSHPSRILLLAPDVRGREAGAGGQTAPVPDGPAADAGSFSGIGARISAFCHRLGGGGRHVCCEEITVLARGAAAERLPEAALPLLLPDMPVHLWFPDPRRPACAVPEGTAPSPGEEGAEGAGRPGAAARRVAAMADGAIWSARAPEDRFPMASARSRPRAVVDLDWVRILPWRELTAQLFDAPDRRPLLERLESVEVAVAGPPIARPGAGWLWLGWLASRLGWEAPIAPAAAASGAGGRETERRLKAVEGVVSVRVTVEQAGSVAAGELLAVRLFPRGSSSPLALERRPMPDPAELCISQGSDRCVHLGIRDEAALLAEALGAGGRDPLYETAWDMALRLWNFGT